MQYNKGTTIVEILISICIISIVVLLLFSMLTQVRNEDVANQIQSTFVINQATIIKEVEEDIINYGIKNISSCSLQEGGISGDLINNKYLGKYTCIKIQYAADYTVDNIGFLMLYNTYARYDVEDGEYEGKADSAAWMIQYKRGHYQKMIGDRVDISSWKNATQIMKIYPSDVDVTEKGYVNYTNALNPAMNSASIVIPIENGEGEHYDINLAYSYKGENSFKCITNNPNDLKCNCLSGAC